MMTVHNFSYAVSGMHYTGTALHIYPPAAVHGMAGMQGGAGAGSFLVPLIFGITILTMVVTAAISLSPTDAELRRENEAMARIASQFGGNLGLGSPNGQGSPLS
jgi:hypothetical protein